MTTARNQLESLKIAGGTEQVIYRPGAGRPREIAAIVDREGREDHMHAATPQMRITVINDPTDGIEPSRIDTGGDRVDVAEHAGGSRATRRVRQISSEDAEWVTVEAG